MTYGEARDKTLQLINQYTMGGQIIASTYNDQQDVLNRIPGLLNDAMVFIATNIRPIPAQEPLHPSFGFQIDGWDRYDLPDDYYEMDTAGLLVVDGDNSYRTTKYRLLGNEAILVPKIKGHVLLMYHRMPTLLPAKPDDNKKLFGELSVQYALPYYAAAQLILQDDAYAYTQLYNEWTTRTAQLRPKSHAEHNMVEDVYGCDMWGDF